MTGQPPLTEADWNRETESQKRKKAYETRLQAATWKRSRETDPEWPARGQRAHVSLRSSPSVLVKAEPAYLKSARQAARAAVVEAEALVRTAKAWLESLEQA